MSTPICSGRFVGCGGEVSFPSIVNYNYPGNLSVRGIDNREFTWEEVYSDPEYNYDEATTNGLFNNSYVADNTPSNVTGVNYVTYTSTLTDSSTYTGWTLTGTSTVYIGISGMHASSGQLVGFTGNLTANPIEGNESIGLYVEPDSASNRPQVISDSITNTEGGVIPTNQHQVYGIAKAVYGASSLKAYVVGYITSTPVAYYDYTNNAWSSSEPTGSFALSSSGYTTIQYNFTAADYPGSTPTSFRLIVESYSTGSFIVIDDFHIDAYLKQDPYSTYSLPTGYLLQITPDLGWHDKLELFDDIESNPHLRNLGIYTTAQGNLRDNLDNSVTAIVDQTDFDEVTSNTYKKYLWRALPVSSNGTIGEGGKPEAFKFIGTDLNDSFTIDSVDTSQTTLVKTIVGSKTERMTVYVNGDPDYPGMEYPTLSSWKLTYSLNTPKEIVTLKAKDKGGAFTSERYIELSSKLYTNNYQALWNVFDEHGLVADTQRLPKETNSAYAARIKDAYVNRGGAFFEGIVNGATRELGLNKITNALTISPYTEKGRAVHSNIEVDVTAYSVRISSNETIHEETVFVDPVYGTVDLTYRPKDIPISALVDDKDLIPPAFIKIVEDENDLNFNRFLISYPQALGRFITVRYFFRHEVLFKEKNTLNALAEELNAISTMGKTLIKCSISPKLGGNESPLGLYLSSATLSVDRPTTVAWSPVYLNKMSDRGFREYFINNSITYRESKFYEYVKELQTNSRVFWGSVEADRDFWDAADSKDLSFDSIPTLFDPPISQFQSIKENITYDIEPINAWGRNYSGYGNDTTVNVGITNNLFQPGVGRRQDLQPEIYTDFKLVNTKEEFFGAIPSSRNNNNTGIFTGQI